MEGAGQIRTAARALICSPPPTTPAPLPSLCWTPTYIMVLLSFDGHSLPSPRKTKGWSEFGNRLTWPRALLNPVAVEEALCTLCAQASPPLTGIACQHLMAQQRWQQWPQGMGSPSTHTPCPNLEDDAQMTPLAALQLNHGGTNQPAASLLLDSSGSRAGSPLCH